MHLTNIKIKNFRALEDIYVDFSSNVNVIVGPNAAGKTTVLEAVRLLKALLAPRMPNEAAAVLQSLGASSPHLPNRIRIQAIARAPEKDVLIGCRFWIGESELEALTDGGDAIARAIVQGQLGQNFAAPEALVAFLASTDGKEMFDSARAAVVAALAKVKSDRTCYLELTVSPTTGITASSDPMEMQFVAFLERRLPPYKTSFTYFPADRALPAGEQGVQLGGPDAAQQLESYNSQPQLKFNRLKNTIFAASVIGDDSISPGALQEQFSSIFDGILKGRKLRSFGVNEIGLLTVLIEDTETGRVFDLDGMSSGEKGLILTFLLIARSVEQDGMILLDEPELHLNPAVCKDLLSYLIEKYVTPRNLQVLVCSHSPEILAGAFDNDLCSLYHLISSTTLSKVRPQDELNLNDALRRLGTNESENLLYRGVVFVEGPDDAALLEAGFSPLLRRYRLKQATGRKEVEKAIKKIQATEQTGSLAQPTYFVFDRDDEPTQLASSTSAKVLQWKRRCLENYLIDLDTISDLLMDAEVVRKPYTNTCEVSRLLRDLAFQQLEEVAARRVYNRFQFTGLGMRKDDVAKHSIDETADALIGRIEQVKRQVADIDPVQWKQDFLAAVEREKQELQAVWEISWVSDCDGKRLLEDLSKRVQLAISVKRFKIRLMKEMALNNADSWKAVESDLRALLGTPTT